MKTEIPVPVQIIAFIQTEKLAIGSHLPAQLLADRLRISRSPVNQALELLADKGILKREPNRGYFIARPLDKPLTELAEELGLDQSGNVSRIYFQIADDRLKGLLPDEFSEALIRKKYDLTPAQLQAVLSRIAQEGWAQKKPGYGWEFSSMLTTPESLLQSYRLRLALEPAAILEPGYNLSAETISRCRAVENHLLGGGIETDTPDQLHDRGVSFHEALVEGSGNPFFIDTIRRVNRVRRLLSYRSMQDRQRYRQHCRQHLEILDLLEQGRNLEASVALRDHLKNTLENLEQISSILRP